MGHKSRIGLLVILLQLATYASSQELNKRSPQGFLGMRGKKYSENDFEHFFKRRPQFFVGVKGKKSLLSQPEVPDIYKRAPMGFVGMRGKKEFNQFSDSGGYDLPPYGSLIGQIDYATNGFDDSTKPIPFLKYLLTEYFQALTNPEENVNLNFDFDNQTATENVDFNDIENQSATIPQYYGVREKKSVQTKRPFDVNFRGKFIGVRGKKDGKANGINQIKFFLDHDAYFPKRGAHSNGFFGMRGKKWNDHGKGNFFVLVRKLSL